jgi:hypothetical protein
MRHLNGVTWHGEQETGHAMSERLGGAVVLEQTKVLPENRIIDESWLDALLADTVKVGTSVAFHHVPNCIVQNIQCAVAVDISLMYVHPAMSLSILYVSFVQ